MVAPWGCQLDAHSAESRDVRWRFKELGRSLSDQRPCGVRVRPRETYFPFTIERPSTMNFIEKGLASPAAKGES